MKRYVNGTSTQKRLVFSDGVTYFLSRGQEVTSDKEVTHVDSGIKTKDVRRVRTKTKDQENSTEE